MEISRDVYTSLVSPLQSGVGGERVICEIGHGITKTNKQVKNSTCFCVFMIKGFGVDVRDL